VQDPFPDGACLTRAAYSVYASASLFSYLGVGNPTDCESVIIQVPHSCSSGSFASLSISTDSHVKCMPVLGHKMH
jgi:hypothetical protein